MISENLALRLEGPMGIEHYEELPGRKTVYNSFATVIVGTNASGNLHGTWSYLLTR